MKKLACLIGLLTVALFLASAAKATAIDPTMVVGGAGGCGTPLVSIGVPFTFTATPAGGSPGGSCPAGFTFQNGTSSTFTSVTVTTSAAIPIGDPCGPLSTFSGSNLFTSAVCSYNSGTQVATIVFSGIGPCAVPGNNSVAIVGTCSGIAPGADFFFNLGTIGWIGLDNVTPASFSAVASVPEPASLMLLGAGLGLLGLLRQSQKTAA